MRTGYVVMKKHLASGDDVSSKYRFSDRVTIMYNTYLVIMEAANVMRGQRRFRQDKVGMQQCAEYSLKLIVPVQ